MVPIQENQVVALENSIAQKKKELDEIRQNRQQKIQAVDGGSRLWWKFW